MKNLSLVDKYNFYEKSVQNPLNEVKFMRKEFKKRYQLHPLKFREDFCGTGMISCLWVKTDPKAIAYGIDLDPEPIEMGKQRHHKKLNLSAQKRMQYRRENVLTTEAVGMDVICAFNFSYYIFKERNALKKYFLSVKKSLKNKGVFFLDLFGGPESQRLVTDTRQIGDLKYYWECQEFNPLNHHCRFAIHFKHKKFGMHKNVFTYDWRFWTITELRDLLYECGFKEVAAYWEGDDGDGGGDGEFEISTHAENCEAWVSYLAAFVS